MENYNYTTEGRLEYHRLMADMYTRLQSGEINLDLKACQLEEIAFQIDYHKRMVDNALELIKEKGTK